MSREPTITTRTRTKQCAGAVLAATKGNPGILLSTAATVLHFAEAGTWSWSLVCKYIRSGGFKKVAYISWQSQTMHRLARNHRRTRLLHLLVDKS